MNYVIGAFDKATNSVPVTFTYNTIKFERPVNAVLKTDGTYDSVATEVRVKEVANGVLNKINLGLIQPTPAK